MRGRELREGMGGGEQGGARGRARRKEGVHWGEGGEFAWAAGRPNEGCSVHRVREKLGGFEEVWGLHGLVRRVPPGRFRVSTSNHVFGAPSV